MLNKFKKAVTYICKKIKQGIKIMARTINDAKCATAKAAETGISVVSDMYKSRCDVHIKKLDALKSFGSTVHSDASSICSGVYSVIKNNKIPVSIFVLFLGFGISGGLISSELINKKEAEPCLTNSNEQ